MDEYEHEVVPKKEETKALLQKAVQMHHLFATAHADGVERCVEALARRVIQPGEMLVEYGAVGDFFFVVETGLFECFVPSQEVEGEFVSSCKFAAGDCFGELALLYGGKRKATITACTVDEHGAPLGEMAVWTISSAAFQSTLARARMGESDSRRAIASTVMASAQRPA